MANVTPLKKEQLADFAFVFEGAETALGAVPNSMLTMGHKPGILGAFALLSGTVFHMMNRPLSFKTLRFFRTFLKEARRRDPENEIPRPLQQLIAYTCSVTAGCRYCQAHTAKSATLMKVPQEKIDALPKYDTSPLYTDAERAAMALAFAAAKVPNESTKEHFDELRKHFNEKQIVEIVAVISLFGFLNRWNDTMATALESKPLEFAEENLTPGGWKAGKHAESSPVS